MDHAQYQTGPEISANPPAYEAPAYETDQKTGQKNAGSPSDDDKIGPCGVGSGGAGVGSIVDETADFEKQKAASGHAHFKRLGWKRLTIVMIVEAIALGTLSLPSAFASLGMVAGVILCVGIGILAIYTSFVIGQVKIKFPHIKTYADTGTLLMGRFGYELFGIMFSLLLVFLTASHCLTGTIAFQTITQSNVCTLVFGVVSAIILFALAVPPSFAEVAILGYVDFASILLAIGITIVGTGVVATESPGLSNVNWSAWPHEGTTYADAFIAVANIGFAYTFAMCQFSFMEEMHTPVDYVKSITLLGGIEIVIYTVTGALIYVFVGQDVLAPALLSAPTTISRIAFGVGLPVIFISGSINTTVLGRYIHGRIFEKSVVRFINTKTGWLTWLGVLAVITVIAWVIAEAIPIFNDLLSIMSSLFVSAFSFYIPAVMWFALIKEGKWSDRKNLPLSILNAGIFIFGVILLVGGLYGSVVDIMKHFASGKVGGAFSCGTPG